MGMLKSANLKPVAPHIVICSVHAAAEPPTTIDQVLSSSSLGVRCHVISDFVVSRLVGAVGPSASVNSVLCACFDACGHVFPWNSGWQTARSVKRPRQALPCGHWIFHPAFRLTMDLTDKQGCTVTVGVSDARGDFFGVDPAKAAVDAEERQRVQLLLDALTSDSESMHERTLSLVRVDGPGIIGGAFQVCDTTVALSQPVRS